MNYEESIRGMEAFVRAAAALRPVRGRSEELLRTLEALSLQRKNLEGALLILLLGGTGVGKSTVLNAIAGAAVAEVSAIRPCTTSTTFYSHRDNDLGPLAPVVTDADRVVVNDSPGLAGKIVADPPDFDSMMQTNRRRLLEVLKVADLVLCVVDPEKYANLALYRLLRRFGKGRSFLFLLNKADFGIDRKVIEDFRLALSASGIENPRIFTASARNAFLGRGDPGDFAALQEVIRGEIDRAAIRRIKNSNLSALVAHTHQSILGEIPEEFEKRLEGIPKRAEERLATASERIASELGRALFEEDPRVRDFVLSSASRSIGGPFGMYLAAAGKLSSLFARRLPVSAAEDPVELRVAVRNALGKADAGRIRVLLERVGSETASELAAIGVDAAGIVPDAAEGAREVVAGAAELAGAETTDYVERASAGWVGTLLYNLVPLAWIAYCAYRLVSPGSERAVDLLAFLAVLLGIFLVQHPMAERAFRRRGGRFIRSLESRIAGRVREDLAARFLPPIRSAAETLASQVREFRGLNKNHR